MSLTEQKPLPLMTKPTCPTCHGTGTYVYHWSISAKSFGTSVVPCPTCQPKPYDYWKYAS